MVKTQSCPTASHKRKDSINPWLVWGVSTGEKTGRSSDFSYFEKSNFESGDNMALAHTKPKKLNYEQWHCHKSFFDENEVGKNFF